MLYIYISASNSTKLDLEFHNSLYRLPILQYMYLVSASNSTKLKLDFFINSLSLYTILQYVVIANTNTNTYVQYHQATAPSWTSSTTVNSLYQIPQYMY